MKKIRTIFAIVAAIVMMVPSFAFAAVHDPIEDKSSDTATLYMGKVLTVTQDNKFPDITDFNFKLEAVKAWDNANKSTSASGRVIEKKDMPMPAACETKHQSVTVSGTTASITVGNFKGAKNTAKADTAREKFRITPVTIKFKKAGYYMYKITETSSTPNAVPGVQYDKDSYYVVAYVCNKTDKNGNTVSGVYVHDLTSYRNKPGTDTQPNLSDIQNVTDNGGKPAGDNIYTNYQKTGISNPDPGNDPGTGLPVGPDKLEAYKFWNDQTTHDVVITNNVTGNLGDVTKEFEFTVTLTGLEKGVTYTTGIKAEFKDDKNQTSPSSDLVSADPGKINPADKSFTADANGKATLRIKLADDEVFVMNALPATSKYRVEEHESDHISSYKVSSTSKTAVIAKDGAANTSDHKAISTAEETVDAVSNVSGRTNSNKNDGTVTIAFVNHRNLITVTGLPYYGDYISILAVSVIIALAVFLRKRSSGSPEEL